MDAAGGREINFCDGGAASRRRGRRSHAQRRFAFQLHGSGQNYQQSRDLDLRTPAEPDGRGENPLSFGFSPRRSGELPLPTRAGQGGWGSAPTGAAHLWKARARKMDLPRKPAFHPRKPVAKLPRVNQLYYGDNLLFKSPKVGSRCDDRTAQAPSPPTIPRRRSRRLKTRGIGANRPSASSTKWCLSEAGYRRIRKNQRNSKI